MRTDAYLWDISSCLSLAALPSILRLSGKPNAKIIEINAEPTPLTQEGISDYLIQEKTGDILPAIVETVRTLMKIQNLPGQSG